jgi:penicillin-binding protein 1B
VDRSSSPGWSGNASRAKPAGRRCGDQRGRRGAGHGRGPRATREPVSTVPCRPGARSVRCSSRPSISAALEQPERYGLATLLWMNPAALEQEGGPPWEPKTMTSQFAVRYPSTRRWCIPINVATAAWGGAGDVPGWITTLQRLGLEASRRRSPTPRWCSARSTWHLEGHRDVPDLRQPVGSAPRCAPSAGWWRRMARSCSATPARWRPWWRRCPPLLTRGLAGHGAGGDRGLAGQWLLPGLKLAGKTGTTDDLRDSWFAGYSGRSPGVIWIGRDDNQDQADRRQWSHAGMG